jgi:Acetamidase/Formamidase family
VDVVEFRPEPGRYAWTFGGVAPTHRITPGTVLRLWTEDAFSGRLRRPTDRPSEVLDMTEVNPQTGPFHVEGAEPGDTLALHVAELVPARDWAASTTIPFFGALTGTDRTALLQEPLPELTWIYQLDRAAGTVLFEAHRSDFRVELPLARCSAPSASRPPVARCARPWCPTSSAATWTLPRCAPAPRCTWG